MSAVLDASAVLAFLGGEAGADRVARALMQRGRMSAVNWAEVLAHRPHAGGAIDDSAFHQITAGDEPLLEIVPFDEIQARQTARIKAATTGVPLSLADRACLALGQLHGLPVLTADRTWRSLGLKVKVVLLS